MIYSHVINISEFSTLIAQLLKKNELVQPGDIGVWGVSFGLRFPTTFIIHLHYLLSPFPVRIFLKMGGNSMCKGRLEILNLQ
jgi:hypothetical protein